MGRRRGAQRPLEVEHRPHTLDLEALRVERDRITLRGDDPDLTRPGVFGLEWSGGYTQVGAIIEADGGSVTRRLLGPDRPPVAARARLDSFAYQHDPLSAHGIAYQEVTIATAVGPAPAWYVPGERHTTVIFVHGRGARRSEALRALPTISGLGFPALVISYRNDRELVARSDGSYDFGTEEWRDLEAAVAYALDDGAGDVVIFGFSMGGAITLSFLERSSLAGRVSAVVLEAPAVQLASIADLGMESKGVPGPLTGPLRALVTLRYDVDWSSYDYRAHAEALPVPLLLFHGGDDDIVPVASSRSFAEAAPDGLVTYVEFPGAGHVQAWNADRERYERALGEFLTSEAR